MLDSIGVESGASIINGAHVLRTLVVIHPAHLAGPPPPLQVHLLIPFPFVPPLSLLIHLVFLPRLAEPGPVRRAREHPQECREGQVMVAAEEYVRLPRVPQRQRDQEIQHPARVGPPVAVVSEENDEGGGEIGRADGGFEVGPEGPQLGGVAVNVAYATDHSGAVWLRHDDAVLGGLRKNQEIWLNSIQSEGLIVF